MRTKWILTGTLALMLGAVGCSDDPAPAPNDGGTDTGNDGAVFDVGNGSITDTGRQGDVAPDPDVFNLGDVLGTDVVDGGAGDASTTDAPPADAGTVLPNINDCTPERFQDRTGASAERTVTNSGLLYNPACMLIAAGQTVTFNTNFGTHPLAPGRAPSRMNLDPVGSSGNPIVETTTGSTATFTFTTPGTYPYYCTTHESGNMYGVIRVR